MVWRYQSSTDKIIGSFNLYHSVILIFLMAQSLCVNNINNFNSFLCLYSLKNISFIIFNALLSLDLYNRIRWFRHLLLGNANPCLSSFSWWRLWWYKQADFTALKNPVFYCLSCIDDQDRQSDHRNIKPLIRASICRELCSWAPEAYLHPAEDAGKIEYMSYYYGYIGNLFIW